MGGSGNGANSANVPYTFNNKIKFWQSRSPRPPRYPASCLSGCKSRLNLKVRGQPKWLLLRQTHLQTVKSIKFTYCIET